MSSGHEIVSENSRSASTSSRASLADFGNVRRLCNELQRMVALAESDSILTRVAVHPGSPRDAPAAARAGGPEIAVPLHDELMPACRGSNGK
jgi:hypothetical protein